MDRRYLVVIAVIAVALMIVGVAVWYYYHSRKVIIPPSPAPTPPTPASVPWTVPGKSTAVIFEGDVSLIVSGSPSRPHFESFGILTNPFVLRNTIIDRSAWVSPAQPVPLSAIYGSTAMLQGANGGSYDIGFLISNPMIVPIGTQFPGAGNPNTVIGTVHINGEIDPTIGLTFVPPTTSPFGENVYWSGESVPLRGLLVSVNGIEYSTFVIGALRQQAHPPQGCLKQGYLTFEIYLTNGTMIRAAVSSEAAYGGSIVPSYGGSDIDHYAIRSWGTSGILTPGPSQVIHQGTTLIQIPTSLVASGVCP